MLLQLRHSYKLRLFGIIVSSNFVSYLVILDVHQIKLDSTQPYCHNIKECDEMKS